MASIPDAIHSCGEKTRNPSIYRSGLEMHQITVDLNKTILDGKNAKNREYRNLMEYGVMSWINWISTINITSYKEMSVSFPQQLSLMSTCMAPQNSLSINIICIIITPAYMISRNQYIIKILQEVDLLSQEWTHHCRL